MNAHATAGWSDEAGVLVLPSGRRVRGSGARRQASATPTLGVFVLDHEPPVTVWEQLWLPWLDFGLPLNPVLAIDTLRSVHERLTCDRVEVSCAAGRGRTGCALSVLAIIDGIEPTHAVAYVRSHYRSDAVETAEQEQWIAGLVL